MAWPGSMPRHEPVTVAQEVRDMWIGQSGSQVFSMVELGHVIDSHTRASENERVPPEKKEDCE